MSFFVFIVSRLYSLTIFLAVVLGFLFIRKRAKYYKVSLDDIDNLFLLCLPLAVSGARLYHVVTDWHLYADNPVRILYIWQGGLGIYGALIGGGVGLFIYARIKQINLLDLLDLLAPALILGQGIGRWGNIINGELLPYAYYESAWNFLVFGLQLGVIKSDALNNYLERRSKMQGIHFALYVILYGGGRFFLEFLRTEPILFWGLKFNQYMSLGLVGVGVLIVVRTFCLRRSEL